MERFEVTRERMEAARDYMPLKEKEAWLDKVAAHCMDVLKIRVEDADMPDMYMANSGKKSRFLMAALLGYYFGEADVKPDELMDYEQYDRYAGSHIVSQIERWKSDLSLRNKCYDLLSDWRDLTMRLGCTISGLLEVQNDTVLRQNMAMNDEMAKLPGLMEELRKLGEAREKTN